MNEWKENNEEWRNNNLRNNAPCKYLYDGSETAGDIVIPFLPIGRGPLMWCGTEEISAAKSGVKVISELKNGEALSESEIIAGNLAKSNSNEIVHPVFDGNKVGSGKNYQMENMDLIL